LAWHDNWCSESPLSNKLTPRQINSAGFSFDSKVAELFLNDEWIWPSDWVRRLPGLTNVPKLTNSVDSIVWKDRNGKFRDFSVHMVWEDIRPRQLSVDWCDLVWFSYCIPRHAFILWLAFKQRLKTQDLILQWDVNPHIDVLFPFCNTQPDSHAHLFFDCSFSTQVWNCVVQKAGLLQRPASWEMIVDRLKPRARKKSMQNVIDKLIFAASVYYIWQERNKRLFTKLSRPVNVLAELILSTVRLKMLTFKYKRTANVERLMDAWDLPVLLVKPTS